MRGQVIALLQEMGRNLRDLLPILCVVAVFQALVVGRPMPDLGWRIAGMIFVLLGLTFFVRGLTMSLFPLGDSIAISLARRGNLQLLLGFALALGFGSTFAEPALNAVARQAAAALGAGPGESGEPARLTLVLRATVAAAVGLAVTAGVLRIVKGWPVTWFVLPGYGLAAVLTLVSGSPLATVALDAGAAATSAVNIPLMLALGTGLAAMIRERNPLLDGFGLVAMASLTPMLALLVISLFAG